MNNLKIRGIYKHFKGDYYLVVGIAKDSNTGADCVIYLSLYGDGTLYIREFNDFFSEVDHKKYPDVKQKYRFELQDISSVRI